MWVAEITKGKREKGSTSPFRDRSPTQQQAKPVQIPIFNHPEAAALIPIKMGLVDIATKPKPAWRNYGEKDWFGQSEFRLPHTSPSEDVLENSITCLHSSKREDAVEYCRWTANVFNEDDYKETAILLKKMVLEYCSHLGCEIPNGLFEGVSEGGGQRLENDYGVFEIKYLKFQVGHGWQFTVTSK